MVQTIERHQAGITVGVWALTVMALVLALPRIKADIASGGNHAVDSAADTRTASVANGPESLASVLEATSAASATSSSIAASNVSNSIDSDTAKVLTPGAGSATRTAILDALRQRLKMAGKFRVDHIRTWNRWAFVRATEVVELDKGELQETDMTVAALLELPTGSTIGSWRIVNLWTLPDEQVHPMKDFLQAIREKQRSEHLPAALFPQDLD